MSKKLIPILVKNDPWLTPFSKEIQARLNRFEDKKRAIEQQFGSLKDFANSHHIFGFNYDHNKQGWWYREWAPEAHRLSLVGDFNDWNSNSHLLTRDDQGIWELFLNAQQYPTFGHLSQVKVQIVTKNGTLDRLPAYLNLAIQDPHTHDFRGVLWNKGFDWNDDDFDASKAKKQPFIYECHVGMAQETEGVGSYRDFANHLLPRIKAHGYNVVQLMAIQEHPYYGSFGYHVSNFFAASSRFGTPQDLKYLINKAHEMGLAVIMDLVHSHAVKNIAEGLARLDGSDQYFHAGERGYHTGWDSYLFDYGKEEVLRFLLSNVRYWIEEFHFDGFRYDGITSMLYFHHGENVSFDGLGKYFDGVDWDVLIYLQLANTLIQELKPSALSIAEDMSGMPGLCRPVAEGGIGFDFRLAMGIPDYWIKLLKHSPDEAWSVEEMWYTLNNRRHGEKSIAYAESHDQALVGDKSLAFWLMDKEMYTHMSVSAESPIIDRGIALHKMIRLLTLSLGGEGWLNFIGNEFGHPEWVDFPREGNHWSYYYARRQWSLAKSPDLRYQYLDAFDIEMIGLAKKHQLLANPPGEKLNVDTKNNVLIFERSNLIFIFNFNVSQSIPDYRFNLPNPGIYEIILNSDDLKFGGHGRVDNSLIYPATELLGQFVMRLYIPNRVVMILEKQNPQE